jgi:hypothetical protein
MMACSAWLTAARGAAELATGGEKGRVREVHNTEELFLVGSMG